MFVQITKLRREDRETAVAVFTTSFTHAMNQEGVGDTLEAEVTSAVAELREDLARTEKQYGFWAASVDGRMIGIAAHKKADRLITDNYDLDSDSVWEVSYLYVLPEFQSKGVGSLLIKTVVGELRRLGVQEFCLDSGFLQAQKVWKHLLGVPTAVVTNYWGEGKDHLIWHMKTAAFPRR